mmetsp:Transcript_2303/g.4033  ORF Transcript_2303/g.4033 Transcript_2303/m.4033 type:complete len:225 (+) Transcript_2303:114-788(+)
MENERGAAVAVGRSTAGAVVVPRRLAHAARKTLQKAGWLKKGRNVTPYHGSATDSGEPQARVGNEGLAVHVNAAGAAVLAQSVASSANPANAAIDEGSLPADLATLLRDSTAVFLDNYRPGMQLYRPSGEAGAEVAAMGGSNREEMTGDGLPVYFFAVMCPQKRQETSLAASVTWNSLQASAASAWVWTLWAVVAFLRPSWTRKRRPYTRPISHTSCWWVTSPR